MAHRNVIIGGGIALGIAASMLLRRRRPISLQGRTVFVTGGSRGLGLLLAQEFASRGARIAISARDRGELERAEKQIRTVTDQVLALEVDMTMREEVEIAVQKIEQHFGPLDVLVNNAGTICVGPVETMTIDDYRDSINTHFWGPYFAKYGCLVIVSTTPSRPHRQDIVDWRQDQCAASASIQRGEIRFDPGFQRASVLNS